MVDFENPGAEALESRTLPQTSAVGIQSQLARGRREVVRAVNFQDPGTEAPKPRTHTRLFSLFIYSPTSFWVEFRQKM
jgi:hypothetical protein